MPKIKRLPADDWFSKCIRIASGHPDHPESLGWICEKCGTQYEENSQGLHCSHYFGRRCYATRFTPNNANAHCFSCHQLLGGNPDDFYQWKLSDIGSGLLGILREQRDSVSCAKSVKKDLKGVTAHYREEFKRLKALRDQGITGKLEIIPYV